MIEVPALAACLTLSKNDFIRTGARGATYLGYRKTIQEVVSRQLADWGDSAGPEARPRIARLERDLERVSRISRTTFPCCSRSSIAAAAGKTACRCLVAAAIERPGHSSPIC